MVVARKPRWVVRSGCLPRSAASERESLCATDPTRADAHDATRTAVRAAACASDRRRARAGSGRCLDAAGGARRSPDRPHLEQVGAPGGQVEVQAALEKVVAAAVVSDVADAVDEAVQRTRERRRRQADEALARMRREVDRDAQPGRAVADPGPGDEAVVGRVAVPRRSTLEQRPAPRARMMGYTECGWATGQTASS